MIPLRDSVTVQRWPVVTWLLIAINVWVFLDELLLGPELEAFIRTWAFIPARYFALSETSPGDWAGRYLPIFTSMFLHGGWLHLLGNMVYLWIFGDNVEDRLGHVRYLIFYLVTGVGAALVHAHLAPGSTLPTVGASGAISVVEIPAVVYLGFWFAMQVLNGAVGLAAPVDGGGVAWWAHIGGFVMGMAVAALLRARRPERRPWRPEYAPW